MTAATSPVMRRESERKVRVMKRPLAASCKATQGAEAMVITSGTGKGYFCDADATKIGVIVGVWLESVDNSTGSIGALSASLDFMRQRNCVAMTNDTNGTPLTAADREGPAYVLDNVTVTGVVSAAVGGTLVDIDSDGVCWIELKDAPVISGLTAGSTLAFTAGAVSVASPGNRKHYNVPTTSTNSTIDLGTTGAVRGDSVVFTADGTANGHTVTYRDGTTAISAAATASKRHHCTLTFDGTVWTSALVVGP